MTTLKGLNKAIGTTLSALDGLFPLVKGEWLAKSMVAKTVGVSFNVGNLSLIEKVQQVIATFGRIHSQSDADIRATIDHLKEQLKLADEAAHNTQKVASQLSVNLQPLIGHISVLKKESSRRVDEAKKAKEEADYQVNKLQYAIDNAGKWVAPYFRPGEPHTRQLIMFPTDTTSVKERLVKMTLLRAQAVMKQASLIEESSRYNAMDTNLKGLLHADGLLNDCRALLSKSDGDIEAAIKQEKHILETGSETLRAFYMRKLSATIEEIKGILG
jgi:hypothetical protein